MLNSRNDIPRPPSSHAFKSEREDSARLYPGHVPIDSAQHPNPTSSTNPVVMTKLDVRANIAPVAIHRTTPSSFNNTSSRSLARISNILVQPPSYDKPNADLPQLTHNHPKDMQGGPIAEIQLPLLNDGDGKPRTNAFPNQPAEYIVARPASRNQLDKVLSSRN